MPKLLLRYAKEGRLRFLSHLETAKLIERALRRSDLPLVISAGFHPKPKISFGPALALGATSTSEYVAVSLESEISLDFLISTISKNLVEGVRLIEGEYIPEGAPSIGRAIQAAAYAVFISTDRQLQEAEVTTSIAWLFKQEQLVVEKGSDVRVVKRADSIIDVQGGAVEGGVEFEFLLSAGGSAGIRPGDLGSLILRQIKPTLEITGIEIERIGLYALVDGRPVDLIEYYRGWKAD